MHNQKDFLVKGLNNSLMLQASTGHADIRGKFDGLNDASGVSSAGSKQRRILDTIDFQIGKLGGQALIGLQTKKPDNGSEIKDFSLGGRLTYGIAPRVKLIGELATTSRKVDGRGQPPPEQGHGRRGLRAQHRFLDTPGIPRLRHARQLELVSADGCIQFLRFRWPQEQQHLRRTDGSLVGVS